MQTSRAPAGRRFGSARTAQHVYEAKEIANVDCRDGQAVDAREDPQSGFLIAHRKERGKARSFSQQRIHGVPKPVEPR